MYLNLNNGKNKDSVDFEKQFNQSANKCLQN